MVLYHYDRLGKLEPGTTISLNENFPTDPGTDMDTQFLIDAFPEGLSVHGNYYLDDVFSDFTTVSVRSNEQTGDREDVWECVVLKEMRKAMKDVSSHMIEFVIEMVRKAYFPHLPSRFQSMFALESPSYLSEWPEIRTDNGRMFEIEVPDNAIYRFDSHHLKAGIVYGVKDSPPNTHYLGFLYRSSFAAAMRYWNGELTDTPRMEYMIPLAIQIGAEVSVPEKVLQV